MATVIDIGTLISRKPEIRGGRPCIAGTGVSVRTIAVWHNMGLIPEQIAWEMDLSLAQIHAALAYYYEHQVEIDAQIMSDWQEVNELAAQQPESPLRQRLRQIKRERERSLVL